MSAPTRRSVVDELHTFFTDDRIIETFVAVTNSADFADW